jgi:hypothetical protein
MRLRAFVYWLFASIFMAAPCVATVFSSLHGVVHDVQHFPVKGAAVLLRAADSDFELRAVSGADGTFDLNSVPVGVYRVRITADGFAEQEQTITVLSGTRPVLHFALSLAQVKTTVAVSAASEAMDAVDSVTPTTLVTRGDIEETPGAGRTIGMEMVTDYVPGAYMTHDMLHMRGGHQTSWLLDGVAIPNTKIASNVGPQIDPKDIEQLQVDRGSYSPDIGDRTYGVFNVLPRNGFERNRDAELMVSAGNFGTAEAQLSFGDHSETTAYYASLTGSRADYGLATPVAAVLHDATNSESGFVSVVRNQSAKDQLRFSGQFRQDYFDIPYDPSMTDYEYTSGYYNSYGLRDAQTERDGFAIANWVHTISPKAMFEVAPFYHLNQSNYDSLPTDLTVSTTWHQSSNYGGAQADLRTEVGKRNSFAGGMYAFYQKEDDLFGFKVNDGTAPSYANTPGSSDAGLVEFYLSDHLRLGQYVTLLGGMRFSIFRGSLNESAAYPRIGATVMVPRLHWVFRGFYGHFFQPAPLETVSSSVLNYASGLPAGENTFTPIPSERDEEHQFGVQIPYRGWVLDVTNVKNRVNNFLDHSNLGESNMYFPIAVDGALVRAWEMTLRSPALGRLGQAHLTYSNQIAEQRGNIIGGFTCSNPSDPACDLGPGYTPVDHDQRNTLNVGFTAQLPRRSWFSTNVYYGSGFTNGLACTDLSQCPNNGPYAGAYLPVHTTFDVSAGHAFGERWKFTASVLNVTNHRVLEDNSVTIGGFHFNDPRMVSATLKYRFHY